MIFAMYPFLYRHTEATKKSYSLSYFSCQHILSCPSRCQAGKRGEAKMLWNSIFADLYCSKVNFAVIACKTEKASSWLPPLGHSVTHVWCHSEEIQRSRERKHSDLSPFYCVKNECCSNPVLLWLINLDSFDEIIRQRGEMLVTTSEFMTVLPLANVTQLQNWQISSWAWDHPRQRQLM